MIDNKISNIPGRDNTALAHHAASTNTPTGVAQDRLGKLEANAGLPSPRVEDSDKSSDLANVDANNTCNICYAQVESNELKLRCGHIYHSTCMTDYICNRTYQSAKEVISGSSGNNDISCPTCRGSIGSVCSDTVQRYTSFRQHLKTLPPILARAEQQAQTLKNHRAPGKCNLLGQFLVGEVIEKTRAGISTIEQNINGNGNGNDANELTRTTIEIRETLTQLKDNLRKLDIYEIYTTNPNKYTYSKKVDALTQSLPVLKERFSQCDQRMLKLLPKLYADNSAV